MAPASRAALMDGAADRGRLDEGQVDISATTALQAVAVCEIFEDIW